MKESWSGRSGFPPAYLDRVGSSFTDFLSTTAPDLLPGRRPVPTMPVGDLSPHGTTIVAVTYEGGVLMGGDRRATMGNLISSRDIEKVYPADSYSVIGIAGAAGIAIEMVKLYQVELEHYEKIEGLTMSLDGKANRLAAMIRGNLGAALQGLAVVPLFAGFDLDAAEGTAPGRIFSYDVTGGNYEERGYAAVGSGSLFAKNSLKKTWRQGLPADAATRTVVEALYDAADDDSATGGPDPVRRLYPIVYRGRSVAVVTYADGVLFIAENPSSTLHKVGEIYDRIGFAAVGRYSEFESLRVAGVRLADVRGYSYNRRDVTGRVIANAYAQTLGAIFTEQMKPYEVELCVAEVGDRPETDQLYRLTFDGSVVDEPDFVVMGGQAEAVTGHLREHFLPGMGLADALQVGVRALSAVSPVTAGAGNGGPTQLMAAQLEVAVLDRRRPKRAFRRITGSALRRLLGDEPTPDVVDDAPPPSTHAPSVSEPGTPAGLGDPANPDTAGGVDYDTRHDEDGGEA